jgi:hypothetical protein
LILGARLAARLGGSRLSRRLFRAAHERYPADARARYFGQHVWTKGSNHFEQLSEWERNPELENRGRCDAIGGGTLREARDTGRDALAGLALDHCAKYLAHREAEACAPLEEEEGLLATWHNNRGYFSGSVEEGEWFVERRRYLLEIVSALARALAANDRKSCRKRCRRWW